MSLDLHQENNDNRNWKSNLKIRLLLERQLVAIVIFLTGGGGCEFIQASCLLQMENGEYFTLSQVHNPLYLWLYTPPYKCIMYLPHNFSFVRSMRSSPVHPVRGTCHLSVWWRHGVAELSFRETIHLCYHRGGSYRYQ